MCTFLLYTPQINSNSLDRIWYIASSALPGVPVQPYRTGIPGIGSQEEPYYDLDLFYPEDYFSVEQGSVVIDAVYGERRIDPNTARNPYLRANIAYLTTFITNPTFRPRGGREYRTSRANAQHYGHYVGQGSAVGLTAMCMFVCGDCLCKSPHPFLSFLPLPSSSSPHTEKRL